MKLTPEQQAMLNGEKGETMAKVVKTLVMYGDAFGAERMVPVTSKYGHTVISFGLKAIKPVYELYDQLIDAGLTSAQKFTADPRPIDDNIPTSLLEDIVFKKIMYTHQASYEEQLKKLGIKGEDDYTCTCYMDEVGNKPAKGEVLSWAESSAVVYANSVLGARCNRNSGIIELMGSVAGFVPEVLNTAVYEAVIAVSNEDAFAAGKLVGRKEGVLVGISSGAAVHAAVQTALKPENEGKTIVVLLPDTGDRYLSTPLFS